MRVAQVRRLRWARVPVLLLLHWVDLARVPCLCLWGCLQAKERASSRARGSGAS